MSQGTPLSGRDAQQMNWICPRCRSKLLESGKGYTCPKDNLSFSNEDGIWRFLPNDRIEYYRQFIEQYETVRLDEGWGMPTDTYYNALPFEDVSGKHNRIWQIRAKSFDVLVSQVIEPIVERLGRPLQVLDLGAGNSWLSHQLARKGHEVTAVDLLVNQYDGLATHIYYASEYVPVQAEFDRLPIEDQQLDLLVFNGSLHYSTNYQRTLSEGLRVLRPEGRLVVMDTPIYRDPTSGVEMVSERQNSFAQYYNIEVAPLDSRNFLTFDQLNDLATSLDLTWTYLRPKYGLRWELRFWRARLRGSREPATFLVIKGRRK